MKLWRITSKVTVRETDGNGVLKTRKQVLPEFFLDADDSAKGPAVLDTATEILQACANEFSDYDLRVEVQEVGSDDRTDAK